MARWPEPYEWPYLVVDHWRPPVFGLEELGWQKWSVTLYPIEGR